MCYDKGIPLIVDASQAAGSVKVSMKELNAAEFICAPGHKGLYGPQGTGLLLCKNAADIPPLIEGGTGSDSALLTQPEYLPDRFESGTQNTPGISGLAAGMDFVMKQGLDNILAHERELISYAADCLGKIGGITTYMSSDIALQSGVMSFNVDEKSADHVAETLAMQDVAVRSGLHCAPVAHGTAGTTRGTVRVSVSWFNDISDIDALVEALF